MVISSLGGEVGTVTLVGSMLGWGVVLPSALGAHAENRMTMTSNNALKLAIFFIFDYPFFHD
jgi:hypothetical protein